jgi:hypothetical protein
LEKEIGVGNELESMVVAGLFIGRIAPFLV